MEINVVNIIIDSLMANGKCSIDGLGTFVLNKSTAVLDAQSNTYIAPSKTIVFTDELHSDYSLSDELLKVYPFSEAKSNKIVRQFSNKVLNGLINFDQVKLKNLGRLKSRKNGIEFEISNTLQDILDASSPSVDLAPFKDAVAKRAKANKEAEDLAEKARIKEVEVADAKAKLEESKQYSERLATAEESHPSVLPISSADETVVPELKSPPPIITPPTVDPKTTIGATNSNYKSTAASHVEHKEGFWSIWLPWLLLLFLLAGLFWGINKIVKLSQATDEVQTFGNNFSTTTDEDVYVGEDEVSNEEGEDESNEIESNDETTSVDKDGNQESNKTHTSLSECVIITGVYRKQHNIDSMVSKIKGAGYEVYTEPSGHYTRIGFSFNCKNVDLQSVIDEVRQTIAKDAWYLVPDVEM